jgi:hypothetical protein
MFVEILKILVPLLGGGAVGALLNEWLRRRNAKVQAIPLVERVNRLVEPGLKGFTLARTVGNGQLEEIKHVREYQFTLRNTSGLNLQDAEIQFDFPAQDVEGRAERPALSNTAPVSMEVIVSPPWKKGFRWRIPQFPTTDSMEFTFRAVDPDSDEYEVAFYKSDRVVIEKVGREPNARRSGSGGDLKRAGAVVFVSLMGSLLVMGVSTAIFNNQRHVSNILDAGCSLTVISSFGQMNGNDWPWQGPWQAEYRVLNEGGQKCVLMSDQLSGGAPVTIEAWSETTRTAFSPWRPKLVSSDVWFGRDGPTHKMSVKLYAWTVK